MKSPTAKNTDAIRIQNEQWFLVTTRNMSFWHECLLTQGWFFSMKDFGVPVQLRTLSVTKHGTRTSLYHTNPNFEQFIESLFKLFGNERSLEVLENTYITFGKKVLDSLEVCNRSLNAKTLQSFFTAYQRYTPGLQITGIYGAKATERLVSLVKSIPELQGTADDFISVVTYPSSPTPLYVSHIHLLRVAAQFQKTKNTKRLNTDLEKWVSEFGNIPVNYCDEPWTITDAHAQIKQLLKKDCAKELVKVKEIDKQKFAQKKQLLKTIENSEITMLARGLSHASYLNEYRKNIFSKVSLRFRGVFAQVAEMGGSSNWRDCFYLTPEEMLSIVSGKKISISKIVAQRQAAAMTISSKGAFSVLPKPSAKKLLEFAESVYGKSQQTNKSTESFVKGFAANKGNVVGVAKIILSSKDFAKFNRGDILIAPMTSVDFIPLMKMASAFVTNEGGITSHAAIVAREMNKPCVIGTKLATKVFKDGDRVEVDANSGIVKVISKI